MKVGIYVGKIPPPQFIDQLIYYLADKKKYQVYLYGTLIENVEHYQNQFIKLRPFPKTKKKIILTSIILIIKLIFNQKYSSFYFLKEIKHNSKNFKYFLIRCIKILLPINDDLDLIHIQWAKTIIYYPEMITQIKCPLLLSLRGTQINVSPVIDSDIAAKYKKYFPHIIAFHAVSNSIASDAVKYGAEKKRISVVRPAINKKLLNYRSSSTFYRSDRSCHIISVGRCHWNKGYTLALDAMYLLKSQGCKFHYTIIANGKDSENINFQISDLKLNGFVTFINGLDHKNVIDKISNSDLFLLPSFQEGIANVVLEAMALGVPVISTNCGGMEEVIEDGLNGYLIPIRDSIAISNSITYFINIDSKTRIEMIDNAKKTIFKNHILDNQVEKISKIYTEIIN